MTEPVVEKLNSFTFYTRIREVKVKLRNQLVDFVLATERGKSEKTD
jgi:hypothetical protein